MPTRPSSPATVAPIRSRSAPPSERSSAAGAANDRRTDSGRPAALPGRVDRDIRSIAKALDALAVLIPVGQSLAPGLGGLRGERVRCHAFACGFARIDPRREVFGAQLRKGQQQIAEVAFGVDGDSRHAIDRGFFEQRQAQTGLPAAGHADADRVRGQVARVI